MSDHDVSTTNGEAAPHGPVTDGPVTDGPVTDGPVTDGPVTDGRATPVSGVPPLTVSGVSKVYHVRGRNRRTVTAVDDVSFAVAPGAAVGLVGASGSGKSTLAKMITGSERPTSGEIMFGDVSVGRLRSAGLRGLHREVQMVFQDPYSALNPLHTVEYTVMRPCQNFLGMSAAQARDRVAELLETVGPGPGQPVRGQAPAPAVRRPAAARPHRPRARQRPRADRGRRARLDARRLAAGRGAQAAGRAAPDARAEPAVHHPRPAVRASWSPTRSSCCTRDGSSSTARPSRSCSTRRTSTRSSCSTRWRTRSSPRGAGGRPGPAPTAQAAQRTGSTATRSTATGRGRR